MGSLGAFKTIVDHSTSNYSNPSHFPFHFRSTNHSQMSKSSHVPSSLTTFQSHNRVSHIVVASLVKEFYSHELTIVHSFQSLTAQTVLCKTSSRRSLTTHSSSTFISTFTVKMYSIL